MTRKKEDKINMKDSKKSINKLNKKGDKKVRKSKPKSGKDVEDTMGEKRVMRARLRRVSPAPPLLTKSQTASNNKTQERNRISSAWVW